jgi:hypothetical protein
MSIPCKFERSLLSHEEYETIRLTHHPAIYDIEAAELEAMRPLCVPKTLSELMRRWNRLSWRNDRAALFRSGRPGLAIQVEGAA